MKPITPYQRLVQRAHAFAVAVKFPKSYTLWTWPNGVTALDATGIAESVYALDKTGFEVRVFVSKDGGLEMRAVEKRPTEPWEIRA